MKHLLITTALFATPLPMLAQTAQEDEDKGFLTNLIEDNLSGVGREVNITGFNGALSSAATIERLTIADSEGIWLDLENVVLDWNRSALLRGRIEVEELSAERIIVSRAPIAEEAIDVPAAEATPFSLPELPVSIELGTLQIDRIELGESFVGEPVNISLTGSASLAGGEGEANVTAARLDDIDGEFIIDGSYSNDTQELALMLDISEGADGLAAKKLGIPGQPSIALTIDGEGPISTFAADIALGTDGQDRIAGYVALLDNDGQQGFEVDISGDVTPLLEGNYQEFFGNDLSLTAAGQQLPDGRFDLSAFELQAQRLVLSGGAMIGSEGWPERISVIGSVADPSGDVILLPLAGPETFVDEVRLNVTYNQAVSEDWEAVFNVAGYDRPGLYIETFALVGGGILRPGEDANQIGEVTADFDYAAIGLELDDPGTAEAFGDTISGDIVISRVEDQPTMIESITVRGPGLEATVTGDIASSTEGLKINSNIALQVSALERFSTLAGRNLAGAADLTVISAIDPLNDLYDIQIEGTTDNLAVSIPQVDPLLAGAGNIAIDFQRDTEGTRLETFDVTTDAASITANADLTSEGSDATFSAQINEINDIESSLNGPITLDGTVNQNAAKIIAFDVSGTLPEATLTATGTAAPLEVGFNVLANVSTNIADLETYATLAGRPLDGAANATLSGILLTEGLRFNGDLSAETTDLQVGVEQLDPLLDGTGTISVQLQRNTDTQYRVSQLVLRTPQIRLDADAAVDLLGPIDATFDLGLTEVGLIQPELSGPISAQGTVSRGDDTIASIDVTATAPGLSLDADVDVDTATYAGSGDINAQVDELSDYASLIGQPISGGVSADVSGDFVPDFSNFDLTVDVTTRDLQTGIEQADALLAGAGRLQGSAQRNADGINVPSLVLTTPQVSLNATLDQSDTIGNGAFDLRLNDISIVVPEISGPLTANGTVTQGADGIAAINATANAPGISVTADVDVAPQTYAVSGDVTAEVDELADYESMIGQPVSGGITADASGRFLPDFSDFDLDLDVTTRNIQTGIAQADPLIAGAGRIQANAQRDYEGLRVPSLMLSTPEMDLTGSFEQTETLGNGTFDLRINDVGLVVPEISGPLTANGTASQRNDGVATVDATANAPGITVTADIEVAPETRAVSGDVTAEIDELADYESLIGQPVSGGITADASGEFLPDFSNFDLVVDVVTRNIQSGIAQVDPLIAGAGRIQANAQRDADGLRVPSLMLTTPETNLTGSFQQTDTLGDGTFDLRINDLSLVVPEISGPLTANGMVSQRNDGVATIDATANAPGIAVTADVEVAPETRLVSGDVTAEVNDLADYQSLIGQPVSGGIRADASGRFLPDFTTFDLVVDVVTRNVQTGIAQLDPLLAGAGQIQANAQRDAQGLRVPSLTLTTPQTDLEASFNQTETRGSGTFDLTINNIGVIADNVSGQATAVGRATQNDAGDWAVTANVTAPQVDVDADLTRSAKSGEIAGTVQAAINNLAAYRGLIGQPVSGGVNATVTGSVMPDLSAFDADIDVSTRDIGTGNPTADLLLRGAGTIALQASRTSDGIRISNLDAQTGNISLNGNLNAGDNGTSTGQFNARLRDAGLFTDQLSGPVTADGTASLSANGTIGLDVTAQGPGGIVVTANGDVASGGNLNIDVGGQIPLALANNAIEPRRINGTATLDLSLNGPAGLNAVSGQVLINDARLAAPTLSQALENINGSIGLTNGTAQVDIRSNVSQGGSINVNGQVGLTGTRQANLTVTVDDVIVRDPELYETIVDGQIGVNGPLSGGAQIAGVLNLGETNVQVPSSGVGSLGDLPDVVHIGQTAPVQQTLDKAGVSAAEDSAESGPSGPGFPLDVTINAPSRIFIRGRGLDAELGGTLNLGGTTSNIIPVGQFSLVRGRLDILQQRFELTEGVASLQGDFSPFIRLVAETEARTGTQIRIIVEGPAGEPEVTFESTPDLPQDEVLAQLIFGRDLSEISPLQAVQLAAAVGTLAGRGGGGLIDGFRQNLGLDDFDVTTDDEGNAAVRAGAYLSENVYTDVTINSVGETEINLNLDITDEITAKGTVTATGDTSIGVFFERDY